MLSSFNSAPLTDKLSVKKVQRRYLPTQICREMLLWEKRDMVLYPTLAAFAALAYTGEVAKALAVFLAIVPLCVTRSRAAEVQASMGESKKGVPEESVSSGKFDHIVDKREWETAVGITPADVMNTIPAHCKVRCHWTASLYIVRDSFYAFLTVYGFYALSQYPPVAALLASSTFGWLASLLFYGLYASIMGTVLTGLWVIGHECGHHAFSAKDWISDAVGYVLHTPLLVPFYAWQYTHGKHHKYTNHMVMGETHVPKTKPVPEFQMIRDLLGEDAFAIADVVVHLVFGWPAYLIANITGGRANWRGERFTKLKPKDHWIAVGSEIFPPQWRKRIQISTLGSLAMFALLGYWSYTMSFGHMFKWYFAPYLVTNAQLVGYTWLHHTHEDVPHFGEDSHTWLRGALCTIDRPYPWIIDHLHHEIGSTHVLHHLNFRIPHYHAREATDALIPLLGTLYRKDDTPLLQALFAMSKSCDHTDGVQGVQWYKPMDAKKQS
jgi:omega-6 fatty acid desaturase (delta-12 desaturase)